MRHPALLLIRSVSGLCAGLLGIVSLVTISFAETYALIFMAPFIVTLLSILVLRERISRLGVAAVVMGFAGVLLAVRPGFRTIEVGHVTAAAAAVFVALSTILIRRIAGTERRISLLIVPQLVTVIGSGVVMATHYVPPSASDFGLLIISSAFIAVAQLTLILAAQRVAGGDHRPGPVQPVDLGHRARRAGLRRTARRVVGRRRPRDHRRGLPHDPRSKRRLML